MRIKSSTFFLIVVATLGFFLGRVWERQDVSVGFSGVRPTINIVNRAQNQPEDLDFGLFWNVWQILHRDYLDESKLDPQEMIYGAIQGMVRAVGDPYTAFLPPEQNAQIEEQLEGVFEGVGIQIGFKKDRLAVIAPLEGTPAAEAGLQAGDVIFAIDGEDTAGITLPEAQAKIRGPKGSEVVLTILREGENQPREVPITRGIILVESVTWETRGTIGIVKLRRFSEQTPQEWDEAIKGISQEIDPSGMVIDVRGNPGGFLSGAVYVASEFVDNGVITKQEHSDGSTQNFRVSHDGKLTDVPLTVLINQGSASASEILAGSLRLLRDAVLVGETSFGKGTVQEVENLPNGTSLHITTGRWLLPNGDNIDDEGLNPDIEVKDATESADIDEVLERAIEILQQRS